MSSSSPSTSSSARRTRSRKPRGSRWMTTSCSQDSGPASPGARPCSGGSSPAEMISLAGPIALLFPGQGVQKPGMGKNLYDRYPAARRAFERAEVVLDMPVRRLCFEGPIEELNRTDNIQPCVMTVCWAAYEVWRESYGFENVQVTAGHSLGEIAALAAAGSIPWETALLLVKERGRIMAQAADEHAGGMIAIVGLDEAKVEEIRTQASARGKLWVANRNADV